MPEGGEDGSAWLDALSMSAFAMRVEGMSASTLAKGIGEEAVNRGRSARVFMAVAGADAGLPVNRSSDDLLGGACDGKRGEEYPGSVALLGI